MIFDRYFWSGAATLLAAAAVLTGLAGWKYGLAGLFLAVILLLLLPPVIRTHRSSEKPKKRIKPLTPPSSPIVDVEAWKDEPQLDDFTARTLHAAVQNVYRMRIAAERMDDERVARTVNELCDMSEAIIDKVKRRPYRLSMVQRFFDYHLTATKSILDKYEAFLNSEVYTSEMEYQVKQIEHLLERIKRTFRKQLQRILQDDLMETEMEVNAFERVIRSEGM